MRLPFNPEGAVVLTSLLVFVVYLLSRKPGARREKEWIAILLGVLLILSLGPITSAATGGWIGWFAAMGRLACLGWLIARAAKRAQIH